MIALAVIQRGTGFISIFILSRILDPKGLGIYAFTLSTAQALYGVARLGLEAGLLVSVSKLNLSAESVRAQQVLAEALGMFLFIAAVGVTLFSICSLLISEFVFGAPDLQLFVIASSFMMATQVVSQYFYSVYTGIGAAAPYAKAVSLTSLAGLVLIFVGATVWGAMGAVVAAMLGSTSTIVLLGWRLRRELAPLGLLLQASWPSVQIWELLRLGFPFYLAGLLVTPAEFWFVGFLSRIEGVEALGQLRVVQAIMGLAMLLPAALSGPLISDLSRRMDCEGGAKPILAQLRIVWGISLLIAIVIATVWPLLVGLIFGSSYELARSVGGLAVLAFVPSMLLGVLTSGFIASRRAGVTIAMAAMQIFALVICGPVLVSSMGLVGYLFSQAVQFHVGVLGGLALLSVYFNEGTFRVWMFPLGVITIVLAGLLLIDVELKVGIFVRLLVGLGLLIVFVLAAAIIFTPAERANLRVSLISGLKQLWIRLKVVRAQSR
jgi:O-antigen/teichoic acid export membrane protein